MARRRNSSRERCPYCGSRDTRPIRYGAPAGSSDDRVLGGCVVFEGQPQSAGRGCDRRFDDLPVDTTMSVADARIRYGGAL
jgi:hypothetical protein